MDISTFSLRNGGLSGFKRDEGIEMVDLFSLEKSKCALFTPFFPGKRKAQVYEFAYQYIQPQYF